MASKPYERFHPGEARGLLDPTWPGVTERGVQETWRRNLASFNERQREKKRERAREVYGNYPPPKRGLLDDTPVTNYPHGLDGSGRPIDLVSSESLYVDTGLRPEHAVGPMAGVTKLYSAPFRSSKVRDLLKQPTSYNREDIRQLAEEVISPGGLTGISDKIIHTKKILNLRADGTMSPLFHETKRRFKEGVWEPFTATLKHPTKQGRSSADLAFRPAFYGGPKTPQLKMGYSSGQYRVKRDVAFRNWTKIKRPKNQGGGWYMAAEMMILPRRLGDLAEELMARFKAMKKK
jgi:hypothetical protein